MLQKHVILISYELKQFLLIYSYLCLLVIIKGGNSGRLRILGA